MTNKNDLEVRSFVFRSVDEEQRTIEGVVAPYDETFDAGDFKENYASGVFQDFDGDGSVKLYSEHDHQNKGLPIGKVISGKNTEGGFVIRAKISPTPKGEETWQLIKDGVYTHLSAGFEPQEGKYNNETNTVTHTKGRLFDVSVVGQPAYKTAGITAFRSLDLAVRNEDSSEIKNERGSIEKDMNDSIDYASAADLEEFRNEVDRRLAVVNEPKNDNAPVFRSMGEFVTAHANGDNNAVELYRSYTGATTAKSHTGLGWVDQTLTVINRGRPLVNLFNSGTLPASGLIVTYPYISATSGAVASQAAEGDDLTQLDITVSTGSTAVKTFGVKSDLSLQVINRSDVGYLDAVLQAQASSYAAITNGYARTVMLAASAQDGADFTLSSATAADFLGAVADGAQKIDANGSGLRADFVLMSSDVWLQAAKTSGGNGFAFDVRNDAGRTVGNTDVAGLSGTIAGFPILVDPGLSAKTMYVASAGALFTWENAGAPIRLDAENPVNLTHVYSIYGDFAAAVVNANGLVAMDVA